MLDYLRQRSQSAIIIFFVAIISAVFIINFGPQSQGCGSEGTIWVARVHGKTITINDYRWVERLVRGRYRLPRDYVESRGFVDDVMQGLIERELLARAATSAGLAVGAEDVYQSFRRRDQVHFSWPVESILPLRGPIVHGFRDEDGTLQLEELEEYITHGLQLSERAFTEQQSREILAERMRQMVELNVQISNDELFSEYSRYADRVNLQYVRIYPAFFRETLRPTDDEIASWAAEHSDDVEERYESDRFRYRNVRKQLRLRDITISVDGDASEEEQAARQARAEAVAALAKTPGADFALLARCFSDDARSAAKSGDLGYMRRGMSRFGSEFDEVVFELDEGTVSEVITTKRGLHIVHVVDAREGDISLEDARAEIAERLYRQERGDARAQEVADSILARARDGAALEESLVSDLPELQPDECPALAGEEEEAAAEGAEEEPPRRRPLAPVVRESGFFNRSGLGVPGIGESSELMSAAFNLSDEEPVAEEVLQVRDDLFIIRLAEDGRQAPSEEEFEEERPTYERRLIARKRQEAIRSFVAALRADAEADNAIVTNDEAIRGMGGAEEEEEGEGDEEEEGESEPAEGEGDRRRSEPRSESRSSESRSEGSDD